MELNTQNILWGRLHIISTVDKGRAGSNWQLASKLPGLKQQIEKFASFSIKRRQFKGKEKQSFQKARTIPKYTDQEQRQVNQKRLILLKIKIKPCLHLKPLDLFETGDGGVLINIVVENKLFIQFNLILASHNVKCFSRVCAYEFYIQADQTIHKINN